MSSSGDPTRYTGPDGQAVQQMFAAIAHRYDLLNHLLSLSIDRYWRGKTVQRMTSMNPVPGDACLDLCTGTGDLALEIQQRLEIQTVGADFCHPMLVRSQEKIRSMGLPESIRLTEADAQQLPFPDHSFRFVTVAFGVRNIEHLDNSLGEMLRVLRPGGNALILEFSRPVVPLFRTLFAFYFSRVLPRIGSWVSGTTGPYQYLPSSVRRFPSQLEFASVIESVGFENVGYQNLTGGIAALHWGQKPMRSQRRS